MTDSKEITIHSTIDITTSALETIVQNSKLLAGRTEKGYYRVDTADKVGNMISRFLREKDFESWVKDLDNYSK